MNELQLLYDSNERVIDIHKYTGALFDVVFELNSADTFVAGVASKTLSNERVSDQERLFISQSLLPNPNQWLCDDGQYFDLAAYNEIHFAVAIEKLRAKCNALCR